MNRTEIIDGFVAALELERELGVRSIECDRRLLKAEVAPAPVAASAPVTAPVSDASPVSDSSDEILDFAFLSNGSLSPRAVEMMAKIVLALGKTAESAPVVSAPPVPRAKAYVMLGTKALQRYAPDKHPPENTWFKSAGGRDVLFVRSPEEIVRFQTEAPAIRQIKLAMWQAIKGIKQRIMQ